MKRALAFAALVAAGCTLIVDTDSVRRNRGDGGTAGGSTAGGSGATGGGSGGGGGATGGGMEPPYDGGARCTSSPRPRLRCDAPTVLAPGPGPYGQAVLGATSQGLVAGWSDPTGVHLQLMLFDGGITQLVNEAANPVSRTALSTEGDAWAYTYDRGVGMPVRCFSNLTPDGGDVGVANSSEVSNISVSAGGAVALVLGHNSNTMDFGISAVGCPAARVTQSVTSGGPETAYVSAVHRPGTGPEGFRLLSGANYNFSNSAAGIYQVEPDGGLTFQEVGVNGEGMGDQASVSSANGDWAVQVYGWNDSNGNYFLSLRGYPTDLSAIPEVETQIVAEPTWWILGGCGPGCIATAWTADTSPAHVSVLFTTDDGDVRPRSASDAGWDVACNTTRADTSVGVAYARGRLSVLVAETMRVRMFECDVPPL